ncbi:MAG: carboxypeptidase-like regulatory domain-containing protein, partial [Reichenbachiella sp.]
MKQNKLLLKYILGMCFMMLFSMTSFGQNSVTGVVTSGEDNQGLPGVNILVKGSTNGTVTDIDGTYTISNVQQGESLIFSFIGYKSQEVAVGSQSKIDVSLEV